jgi:3-phenylpropionate/trans-cinnamate dioxygenase ferredoxin reductase component
VSRPPASTPAAHEVMLADGSKVGYARLLLATGSAPRG